MSLPLSLALRGATAEAHASAETASFITDLMEGRACAAAFTALARQQEVIYEALETALAGAREHPLLAGVDDRRLDRLPSLRADLPVLTGTHVEADPDEARWPVVEATHEYARVLREEANPELLLAHHYVRYLGDLSGGQIIARLVSRHYGIPQEALTFYRFDGIAKPKPYKDGYRAALDATPMTEEQRERVLAEAVRAFHLNQDVFVGLGAARAPCHESAGVAA